MGITVRPRFKNITLVSPKSVIGRPLKKKFDTGSVIKADSLRTRIDQDVDKGMNPLADLATISKTCSSSTLTKTAKTLAGFHTPKRIDFSAKFGVMTKGT